MEREKFHFNTVELDEAQGALLILDQTLLPGRVEYLSLSKKEEIWEAIYKLRVRGAPAIGVAAAYGIYVLTKDSPVSDQEAFLAEFRKVKAYLETARPTAVNLFWALDRMEKRIVSQMTGGKAAAPRRADVDDGESAVSGAAYGGEQTVALDGTSADRGKAAFPREVGVGERRTEDCGEVAALKAALLDEAHRIRREDEAVCRQIGEHGLSLLKPGMGLLTHCNAGALATSRYGTALSPIYLGKERGYDFKVYADETRPLLQGARLTAWELAASGIDVTLICDNMAASVMKAGKVQAILTGADRVAANGDSANKIGTLGVAIMAKRFGIPFYIHAPISTIDLTCETGADIKIEERPGEEISSLWYKRPMAPQGVKIFNPAFDVTDADLITAIVTEKGVLRPPYTKSIAKLFR